MQILLNNSSCFGCVWIALNHQHRSFNYCLCLILYFLFCSWILFSTHYSHYTWWLHSWLPSSLITLYPAVDRNVVYMCGLILRLPGGSLLLPKTTSFRSGLVEFSDGWNGLDSKRPTSKDCSYEQALLHISRHPDSNVMVVQFSNLVPNASPYSCSLSHGRWSTFVVPGGFGWSIFLHETH